MQHRFYWICTPQDRSSRLEGYGTLSIELLTKCIHDRVEVEFLLRIWKVGRGSWVGQTLDIIMGSCGFQCYVPHQWIALRLVGSVSVYCNGMAFYSVLAQWSKYHCYKKGTSSVHTSISKPFPIRI